MSYTYTSKVTKYNNILFRSRSEARWAIFFDAMDIEYEYEPEIPKGIYYIPDFYLPQMQRTTWDEAEIHISPMYAEVKSEPLMLYDMLKYKELVKSTGCGLLYLHGLPANREYWTILPGEKKLWGFLICPDNLLRQVGFKLEYQHMFWKFEGESYPWYPFAEKYVMAKNRALGYRDWRSYSEEELEKLEKRRKRRDGSGPPHESDYKASAVITWIREGEG